MPPIPDRATQDKFCLAINVQRPDLVAIARELHIGLSVAQAMFSFFRLLKTNTTTAHVAYYGARIAPTGKTFRCSQCHFNVLVTFGGRCLSCWSAIELTPETMDRHAKLDAAAPRSRYEEALSDELAAVEIEIAARRLAIERGENPHAKPECRGDLAELATRGIEALDTNSEICNNAKSPAGNRALQQSEP